MDVGDMTKYSKELHSNSNRRLLLGLAVMHDYLQEGAILSRKWRTWKDCCHTAVERYLWTLVILGAGRKFGFENKQHANPIIGWKYLLFLLNICCFR